MKNVTLGCILGTLITAPSTSAQRPTLLRDFNQRPVLCESSSPTRYSARSGMALFRAGRGDTGTELFATTGQLGRTWLLTDLTPGEEDSSPENITPFADGWLFVAGALSTGTFLWSSKGTYESTKQIAEVGSARGIAAGASSAYFAGYDDAHGQELWCLDAASMVARRIADIAPGRLSSSILELTLGLGDRVLFSAWNWNHGVEPWISDGTQQGTFMLGDLVPEAASSSPCEFTCLGDRAVFRTMSGNNSHQLWVTNGTSIGTTALLPPNTLQEISDLGGVAGLAWFSADDGVTGAEPWITDGTQIGTRLVADIWPGSGSSHPAGFVSFAGRTWFSANNPINGVELWSSDGTAAGNRLEKDIAQGAVSSSPDDLTAVDNWLYFSAIDHRGREPWLSDGTPAGTHILSDVFPGPGSSRVGLYEFEHLGDGEVLFAARESTYDLEPWSTLGTQGSTRRLKDIATAPANATQSSSFSPNAASNHGVLFARHAKPNLEIWHTDGTPGQTVQVAQITPAMLTLRIKFEFAVAVGSGYFFGVEHDGFSRSKLELWHSDGTAVGTQKIAEYSSYGATNTVTAVAFRGKLWMGLRDLIVSDGTAAGTQALGLGPVRAHWLAVFEDRLLFSADDATSRLEPWISDGTLAGTRQLADIHPTAGSNPSHFVQHAGYAYFAADDGTHGRELWRTNGTSGGTQMVADIRSGTASSAPLPGVSTSAGVFLIADDGVHGREPWFSDGTAAGTHLLADAAPDDLLQCLFFSGTVGQRALFTSAIGPGFSLWSSDGTTAGTFRLPVQTWGVPAVTFRGMHYFGGYEPGGGLELWRTDGTRRGTKQVFDLHDGEGNGNTIVLGRIDERLVFTGEDGTTGHEVWSLGTQQRHGRTVRLDSSASCESSPRVEKTRGQSGRQQGAINPQ